MGSQYEIVLLDQRGTEITRKLSAFTSLEWARKVNDIGSMSGVWSNEFPLYWFRKDYRIEIWRSIDGRTPYLEGDTQWLIRKIRRESPGAGRITTVTAYDLNHLLKRRIIAYDADTTYTSKTDYGDDMMKEIFSENFGLGCIDADRDISDWITIQIDNSLGWPIDKAFTRRQILPTFQEICQESTENGYPLFFDIVRLTPSAIEFRTFLNQRGVDHTKTSALPILFGPNYGNLTDDIYEDDASEESTFVYAGGQGEESARVIETAQDDVRIGQSPFGRSEYFVDARQSDNPTYVAAEAEAELRARVPKRTLTGKIIDTDRTRYGLHYKFGDKVTVETDDISVDARINSVHVSVQSGGETIDIGLEAVW